MKILLPFHCEIQSATFSRRCRRTVAFPTIVPGSVLGRDGGIAPSNRITMGIVGWGMMGPNNTNALMKLPDCQVIAACDLDEDHLYNDDNSAVKTINKFYGNKDCKPYHDYREMMARRDIDAVMLAVPDHWHALTAIEAARHKKDIYGEKPLAHTIAEQQAIVRAVEKNKIIWQTGSWQRSEANFRLGAEIVRNGMIGDVTRVEVGLPGAPVDLAKTGQFMTVTDPPPELDYEMWVGPSKMMPYIKGRLHKNWRWNYNFAGGQLVDWVGHHCDIAHWGLDFDNSGPSEIEGLGEFPPRDAVWNVATKYRIELKYPRNITMIIAGGYPEIKDGVTWIGTSGWVHVNRHSRVSLDGKVHAMNHYFEASNEKWEEYRDLPDELAKVKLYKSTNHYRNFIDCVKSRQPTVAPVQTSHHSTIPGQLGLISMLVGRKLQWDVASEKIINDPEATELMTRDYRAPWKFPA